MFPLLEVPGASAVESLRGKTECDLAGQTTMVAELLLATPGSEMRTENLSEQFKQSESVCVCFRKFSRQTHCIALPVSAQFISKSEVMSKNVSLFCRI